MVILRKHRTGTPRSLSDGRLVFLSSGRVPLPELCGIEQLSSDGLGILE
jgi:hypothetical protein